MTETAIRVGQDRLAVPITTVILRLLTLQAGDKRGEMVGVRADVAKPSRGAAARRVGAPVDFQYGRRRLAPPES